MGISSYIGFTRCNVLWRMPASLTLVHCPLLFDRPTQTPQQSHHPIYASIILCSGPRQVCIAACTMSCLVSEVISSFARGSSHSIINNHNSNLLPLYCSLILFMAMISSVLFVCPPLCWGIFKSFDFTAKDEFYGEGRDVEMDLRT